MPRTTIAQIAGMIAIMIFLMIFVIAPAHKEMHKQRIDMTPKQVGHVELVTT